MQISFAFLLRHQDGTCCVGAEGAHSYNGAVTEPGRNSHQGTSSNVNDYVFLSVGLRQASAASSAAVAHADTDVSDIPSSPTASEDYVKIVQH